MIGCFHLARDVTHVAMYNYGITEAISTAKPTPGKYHVETKDNYTLLTETCLHNVVFELTRWPNITFFPNTVA